MVTKDYRLEDLERSQLDATRRRRNMRSRRYYRLLLITLSLVALAILSAPSIISHTGIARSLLASTASQYGWTVTADSVNVGWITPLSIKQLDLVGASGETRITVGRADTALTVTQLIRFDPGSIGEVTLRGVRLDATVQAGTSSIERDMSDWLSQESDSSAVVQASIQVQDAGASVIDKATGLSWTLDQSNLAIEIDGDVLTGEIAGVVNEPAGDDGAIQSHFDWQLPTAGSVDESQPQWTLSVKTESFPLSVSNLILRRFSDPLVSGQTGDHSQQLAGDMTGQVTLSQLAEGGIRAELGDLRIRNLHAGHSDSHWENELATLDGQVALVGNWLLGKDLEVTTDFAAATLDGSLPTSLSIADFSADPVAVIRAMKGTARLDVDLASFDQAMPGVIPLRKNAQLLSGRLHASLDNSSPVGADQRPRQSHLALSSESTKARADGRIVIIEPIRFDATVTENDGVLRAEHFKLTSSFANGMGSGTLRNGSAKVDIDFGRLYTMLRPVIDFSNVSLGGSATGDINWNVTRSGQSGADVWDLHGTGEAQNLLVTLADGHRFKRSIVQGNIAAKGKWNGRRLEQLSSANVSLASGGVVMSAQLTEAVESPTTQSLFPLRMEIDGRLENLSESLRPWLPEDLMTAEGRLTGYANAHLGLSRGSLSKIDVLVQGPRIHLARRWFTQSSLEFKFDGVAAWPSGNLAIEESTIVGESISLKIRGEASRERTQLDVAWNADLAGLQQSVGATLARAAPTNRAQPISYRAAQAEHYQVRGRCRGKFTISGDPQQWDLTTSTTAEGLAFYQSHATGITPPGSTLSRAERSFGNQFGPQPRTTINTPLWHEPRVQVDGPIRWIPASDRIETPGLKISSDWFAGNLAGSIVTSDQRFQANLSGPSRLKMDLVSQRLAEFLDLPIVASGVHETDLDLKVSSNDDSNSMEMLAQCNLGWRECTLGGLRFGATEMPVSISEQSIKIARTQIPILADLSQSGSAQFGSAQAGTSSAQAGSVKLAGEVTYGSGPATIRIDPNSRIDGLQITPSTAAGWLKYLTPLAADATRLDGLLDAEFDEIVIITDDLNRSHIRGRLNVQSLRLSSGPLANGLIQGVEQIKSIAKITGGTVEPATPKTLVEMKPQIVEFDFANGIVTHRRMSFQVDRAQLVTSGQVATNSTINLVAQVPLDPRWLGSDLKGLAGQAVTFPISGTLSRPQLDSSAVRKIVAEFGTKAGAQVIENRLNSLIEDQLGSGINQLNNSLEKVFGF